jgi:hypothetical protein
MDRSRRRSRGELIVGRRNSLRETLVIAALTGLVLPGLGLLIVPSMIADGGLQLGGTLWVAFWTLPAFAVRRVQREHRLEGEALVSTYHRRVETRHLGDVAVVKPAPLLLPAARVVFSDGRAVWVYGHATERFLATLFDRSPFADDQLPAGRWLRPRRLLWFVFAIAYGAAEGSA